MTKMCIDCRETKPFESFWSRGEKLYNQCKACLSSKHKSRYKSLSKEERDAVNVKNQKHLKLRRQDPDYDKQHREMRKRFNQSDTTKYSLYRKRCERKGQIFDLSFKDFVATYHGSCFYCGVRDARSVDRYDSSKPYIMGNVVPCCVPCNQIKLDRTVPNLYAHLKRMMSYFEDNKDQILGGPTCC